MTIRTTWPSSGTRHAASHRATIFAPPRYHRPRTSRARAGMARAIPRHACSSATTTANGRMRSGDGGRIQPPPYPPVAMTDRSIGSEPHAPRASRNTRHDDDDARLLSRARARARAAAPPPRARGSDKAASERQFQQATDQFRIDAIDADAFYELLVRHAVSPCRCRRRCARRASSPCSTLSSRRLVSSSSPPGGSQCRMIFLQHSNPCSGSEFSSMISASPCVN